ncbi:MAG: iron-containing alcohol dehydrogenase [Spirochaetales bacterium]|nr:iron-containing alcohol dehydrogenase [Spirochaetales bacterium]
MEFTTPFTFELPTRILYGIGKHKEIPAVLNTLKARNIEIITDPGITPLPWFQNLLSLLRREQFQIGVFDRVESNPKDYNVEDAAQATQMQKAECILAIGGGSPIDCAKVASILAVQGGSPRDYEDRSHIGPNLLPILAVPTTAGTGSEVTFGAVITDSVEKYKFTVKSPRIAPCFALLDPELTLSMPPPLTAATGMDALTHAIEAYTSRAAESIADACALHATRLISSYLPRAVAEGNDLEARSALLLGSLLAGIAFSHSDVGAVHCIAEALGGMYDIPHGVCNAVCLPVVMDYCKDGCSEKYKELGIAMGISQQASSPEATVAYVHGLARKVGLPEFRSFSVPPEEFPVVAQKSVANGSNKNNIPVLTPEDYVKILHRLIEK